MLKNFWFQAHWLVGITAGVILAVVGVTGAVMSFETEIQKWLNRDVRSVAASDAAALTPAALVEAVRRQQPDKQVVGLQLSSNPRDSVRVTFGTPGESGGGGRGGPRGENRYADPATGLLIEGEATKGQAFFRGTRTLHRYLTVEAFGNRDIGKQLVGASTLLCVLLALSGLYLRWPRHVRDWRAWLTLDPALKGRSFLWHLHAVVGTWVLVGLVMMSLTGLYWSYDWYRNGMYAIAGVERPAPRGEARPGAASAQQNPRQEQGQPRAREPVQALQGQALDTVWRGFASATASTGYRTATLNLSQGAGRPVEISYLDADPAHERATNTLVIEPATGEATRHERYADKRAGEKFMASVLPLHSGSFFGVPGLVFYMIASLAMPVFAVTGWMLYLDRRGKKRAAKREQREAAAAAAAPAAAGAEPLLLAFASQAGFARQLAWQTAGSLRAAGVPVDVQPLERVDEARLRGAGRALFVVSTFGEGEPPDDARRFVRHFMRSRAPALQGLRFGVLALGDRQYKTFCEFGRTLDQWLQRHGAQALFPPVEVDRSDPVALGRWRDLLGNLAGGKLQAWESPEWQQWRLTARRVLNPGSVGGPTFHLELTPGAQAHWSAGDIAVIQIAGADEPREYSIASIESDGAVHLVIRQARRPDGSLGAGSGWLTEGLAVGDVVRMRLRDNPSFHAPDDDRPLVLIGNGTGIAGLRSLLKLRAARRQRRNWLVFGERNASCDAYYREEIEAWRAGGVLSRVDLVFSRDQPERRYVQDRLREQAVLLRQWIDDGAALHVCGSAQGMATGVHAALVDILGEARLQALQEQGRYRRDVY